MNKYINKQMSEWINEWVVILMRAVIHNWRKHYINCVYLTISIYILIVERVLQHKIYFFNINFFHNLNFKYVHTHFRSSNLKKNKKITQGGCLTPANVPKLGVFGVKDTAKTNKDLGISCYTQVDDSVFFCW